MVNKKVIVIVAIIATIILTGIAIPLVFNKQYILAQQPPLVTEDITLKIEKGRFAKYTNRYLNITEGQWTITVTSIEGNIRALGILLYDINHPRQHAEKWIRLGPSVGDTVSINLPEGSYRLIVIVFGETNSTITLTLQHPSEK